MPKTSGSFNSDFISKLENLWRQGKYICIGLDSDYEQIPKHLKRSQPVWRSIFNFNKTIVDQTHDLVCAYKPNSAFYEACGQQGWSALEKTVAYINKNYPQIPLILDAKRGDIGSTNKAYAKAIFDDLGFDAVTVHPYLGQEALKPFLDYKNKGVIVLVKTSNSGAGEFQDLKVDINKLPLYLVVASRVARSWNQNHNCGLVVGATYPDQLKKIRAVVGDLPILIPGIGAQGGDLGSIIRAGKGKKSWAMIINSSRAIIFASGGKDFGQAARRESKKLAQQIKECP